MKIRLLNHDVNKLIFLTGKKFSHRFIGITVDNWALGILIREKIQEPSNA